MQGIGNRKSRFAYVFYATNAEYARAAMVAAVGLRRSGSANGVETVLMHSGLGPELLEQAARRELKPRRVDPAPAAREGYFRDCLLKLRIFELEEFDRIVYLDADVLPMRSLDHLFEIPLPHGVAAPPCYWLKAPAVSSMMLVFEPSAELRREVAGPIATAQAVGDFDMDILNKAFGGRIDLLPPETARLDTDWVQPGHVTAIDFDSARLYHFSNVGKPWHFPTFATRLLVPRAHPNLARLWNQWKLLAQDVLGVEILDASARLHRLGYSLADKYVWRTANFGRFEQPSD